MSNFFVNLSILRLGAGFLLGWSLTALAELSENNSPSGQTVNWYDVTSSVVDQYPPYLAALIQRDVASGQLRSTLGNMDLQLFAKVFGNPTGFYDYKGVEVGFDQFLGFGGASVFGSYLFTDGFLPDYYRKQRTDAGGTPTLGLKLPLLRDETIDKRRAAIYKARLDRSAVDPAIKGQLLGYQFSALKSYFSWVGATQKFNQAQRLYNLAKERESALQTQIEKGLIPPLADLENRQLIATRSLELQKAHRSMEASAMALSLFYRTNEGSPITPKLAEAPAQFPPAERLPGDLLSRALNHSTTLRPEIEGMQLTLEKAGIDIQMARNELKPRLDSYLSASQSIGAQQYKDTSDFELQVGLEFRTPLQRNNAKGTVESTQSKKDQLNHQFGFLMDRIAFEVTDAHSAVRRAMGQLVQADEAVVLASTLEEAERARFELGAADFLTLQLREQSTFVAQLKRVDVITAYFHAIARLISASGHVLDGASAEPESSLIRVFAQALEIDGNPENTPLHSKTKVSLVP